MSNHIVKLSVPSPYAHAPVSVSEELHYEQLEVIATFIRAQTSIVPEIGVICGSGLGGLADQMQKEHPILVLPYHAIPNFPTCHGTFSTDL
eukprot:Em0018g126a